jgi:succinylglutamate desuccinylase
MSGIKKILIAGGTHGNEMTGIFLVRNWMTTLPAQIAGLDFSLELLLANPEAIRLGRRYAEFDLNRAFAPSLLNTSNPPQKLDISRAREINRTYGPKGSPQAPDLAIDLHNSTANMGISLIVNEPDAPMKRILSILSFEFPLVRLVYQPESLATSPYLPSIARHDLTIEVGPQAHGTLKASLFHATESLVIRLLGLVAEYNSGNLALTPHPTLVYTQTGTLDYPRQEDGSLRAMIHPKLEGADFRAVDPGSPLFQHFDGTEELWPGPQTIWPCFIGEAAYLEKHIAMSVLTKSTESW